MADGVPGSKELMALHAAAQELVDMALVQLSPKDFLRPTPCAEWELRDLLAHMLGQNQGLCESVGGDGRELVAWQPVDPGVDPARRIASSARELVESFARRGLDGSIWMPEISLSGPIPARFALTAHLLDTVVHGWDITSSLGSPYQVSGDLLAVAGVVAARVPAGPGRNRTDSAFQGSVEYGGPSPLGSLLAALGRDPSWSPPRSGDRLRLT